MGGRKMAKPGVAMKLLKGVPYSEERLLKMRVQDLWTLAKALGSPPEKRDKATAIKVILEAQETLAKFEARVEPFCEMCSRYTALRMDCHIIAEKPLDWWNTLRLCPTCHRMLDFHLKPRLFQALSTYGIENLPKSWKSLFDVAREKD